MWPNRDAFLILGCDGVWDVLTSQEAVEFVHKAFCEEVASGRCLTESAVTKVSDSLVQECLDRGSMDNISVVLVTFPAMEQSCLSAASLHSWDESGCAAGKQWSSADLTGNELLAEQATALETSPPPVNVNMVLADMNQNLPPSSPMKGTRLF